MKTITRFDVVNHGVDNCQYFPGAGLAFCDYSACYTGANLTAYEALCDAIEYAAQDDWRVTDLSHDIAVLAETDPRFEAVLSIEPSVTDDMSEDCFHYVTLYVSETY